MSDKRIPYKYFDNLSKKIWDNILNTEDDIENEAPNLSKFSKEIPYRVPEGYFIQLTQIIKKRTQNQRPVKRLFIRWQYAAASLALILASIIGFNALNLSETKSQELAYEEVLDYYLYEDGIDNSLLLELSEEELEESFDQFEDISDEDLDLYMETIIDEFTTEEINDVI